MVNVSYRFASERLLFENESFRNSIQQAKANRNPKMDSVIFEAENMAPADTVQVKINKMASFISDFLVVG